MSPKKRQEFLDRLSQVISQRDRAMDIAIKACQYLERGGDSEGDSFPGAEGWVTDKEINDICARQRALLSEFKPIIIPIP